MSTENIGVTPEPAAWVVVNTQPHREHIAVDQLGRQNFDVYCPRIRKRIRHARKTQEILRPLFPGYVFVRVNSNLDCWRPILSTVGVRTLVRCGDRPSLLDSRFVDALKAREIDGAVVRPASPFRIGQQVRIAGGPFDGIVASILEMEEKDRLVLLLDFLNRPMKARVAAARVVSA